MKIIAIETSHDDTSVVLYEDKKILKEWSYSQVHFHKQYGGTIPEFASRNHFKRLLEMPKKILKENLENLDHVAYTSKPGLIGSLHMGSLFAQAIALSLNVEAKAINHMYGHIFAVCFNHKIIYPALALIASGGHTQLWEVKSVNDINLIGQTKDDAVGEVYDKVARRMKLGFPGGPLIDKLSQKGKPSIDFSLKDNKTFDFSFSGLKTKVINYINNKNQRKEKYVPEDVACSFQKSIIDNLIVKTKQAINEYKPQSIILGGGVAANSYLRKEFAKLHPKALIPEMKYTTDNAMMIAIRSHIKEEGNDKQIG